MSEQPRSYSAVEHFNIEKEINVLIEEGKYDQAVEKIRHYSELYEFKATVIDRQPSILTQRP